MQISNRNIWRPFRSFLLASFVPEIDRWFWLFTYLDRWIMCPHSNWRRKFLTLHYIIFDTCQWGQLFLGHRPAGTIRKGGLLLLEPPSWVILYFAANSKTCPSLRSLCLLCPFAFHGTEQGVLAGWSMTQAICWGGYHLHSQGRSQGVASRARPAKHFKIFYYLIFLI